MSGFEVRLKADPAVQIAGLEEGQRASLPPHVFTARSGIEFAYTGDLVVGEGNVLSFRCNFGATHRTNFFIDNRTELWFQNLKNDKWEQWQTEFESESYYYIQRMGPIEATQTVARLFTIEEFTNGNYARYNDAGRLHVRIRLTSAREGHSVHDAFSYPHPNAVSVECPYRRGQGSGTIYVGDTTLRRLGTTIFSGMTLGESYPCRDHYEDVVDVLRVELQPSFSVDLVPLAHVARRLSLAKAADSLVLHAQRVGYDPRELFRYGVVYDDSALVATTLDNLTADQVMRFLANPNTVPDALLQQIRQRLRAATGQLTLAQAVRILQRPDRDANGDPNPHMPHRELLHNRVKALLNLLNAPGASAALADRGIVMPYVRRALNKIVENPHGPVL